MGTESSRKKLPLGACALFAVLFSTATPAATPILRFDDVRPGMLGVGRTVFHGTTVEEFQVEILGTLPDIGPDQNLILGKCAGGPLAHTGIMSGMSGSPVFVDGKLIGAVAYSWGFAKDAIAGITPIEEMLAIQGQDLGRGGPRPAASSFDATDLAPLLQPSVQAFDAFIEGRARALVSGRGALRPTAMPLAVAGMNPRALDALAPLLRSAGFVPAQTGLSGRLTGPTPQLVPGSAMGLKLVRGAVEMTATGTVTWVDQTSLLAFGHPLFGLGSIDLPLTGADVRALLPSLQQSQKIATPLDEVGALRQDRTSGVFGRIGATPRMIPVRVQLRSTDGSERSFSFDIADDPLLSPLLLYVSMNGILSSKERPFGSTTITLRRGSVIKMLDGEDVSLDNLFAGNTAFTYGTSIAPYVLHLLMNNTWSQPEIAGVNLLVEYDDVPRTARISRTTLSRYRVLPGETVQATIVLRPYRGPDLVQSIALEIPEDTPPGPLSVVVAGALGVQSADDGSEVVLPQNLDQLIRLINQLRRNDRVYLVATREDSGALLAGTRLPGLPPSAARILVRPPASAGQGLVRTRAVLEEAIDTEFQVEGGARLVLEVESP